MDIDSACYCVQADEEKVSKCLRGTERDEENPLDLDSLEGTKASIEDSLKVSSSNIKRLR